MLLSQTGSKFYSFLCLKGQRGGYALKWVPHLDGLYATLVWYFPMPNREVLLQKIDMLTLDILPQYDTRFPLGDDEECVNEQLIKKVLLSPQVPYDYQLISLSISEVR